MPELGHPLRVVGYGASPSMLLCLFSLVGAVSHVLRSSRDVKFDTDLDASPSALSGESDSNDSVTLFHGSLGWVFFLVGVVTLDAFLTVAHRVHVFGAVSRLNTKYCLVVFPMVFGAAMRCGDVLAAILFSALICRDAGFACCADDYCCVRYSSMLLERDFDALPTHFVFSPSRESRQS